MFVERESEEKEVAEKMEQLGWKRRAKGQQRSKDNLHQQEKNKQDILIRPAIARLSGVNLLLKSTADMQRWPSPSTTCCLRLTQQVICKLSEAAPLIHASPTLFTVMWRPVQHCTRRFRNTQTIEMHTLKKVYKLVKHNYDVWCLMLTV